MTYLVKKLPKQDSHCFLNVSTSWHLLLRVIRWQRRNSSSKCTVATTAVPYGPGTDEQTEQLSQQKLLGFVSNDGEEIKT